MVTPLRQELLTTAATILANSVGCGQLEPYFPQTAQRYSPRNTFHGFFSDLVTHRSDEGSRSECNHPDSEFTKISSHREGHSHNRSLAGRVCDLTSLSIFSSHGGNINYNSSLAINGLKTLQMPGRVFARIEPTLRESYVPRRLTFRILRNAVEEWIFEDVTVISAWMIPAQFTKTRILPKCCTAASTASLTSSSRVTSSSRQQQFSSPSQSTMDLPCFEFWSAMTTFIPLLTKSLAVASPRPEQPPVIKAVCPSSFISFPQNELKIQLKSLSPQFLCFSTKTHISETVFLSPSLLAISGAFLHIVTCNASCPAISRSLYALITYRVYLQYEIHNFPFTPNSIILEILSNSISLSTEIPSLKCYTEKQENQCLYSYKFQYDPPPFF